MQHVDAADLIEVAMGAKSAALAYVEEGPESTASLGAHQHCQDAAEACGFEQDLLKLLPELDLMPLAELRAIVHAAEADLNARELIVHGDDFEGGVSDAICSVTAVEKTLANTGGSMLVLPYGSTYGGERRLGMDLYVPAGTRVVCPLAGEVVETVSGTDRLGIAPAVLMRHRALGIDFYCMYGGVADVAASVGTVLAAGQELGSCANAARNGGHVPRGARMTIENLIHMADWQWLVDLFYIAYMG